MRLIVGSNFGFRENTGTKTKLIMKGNKLFVKTKENKSNLGDLTIKKSSGVGER